MSVATVPGARFIYRPLFFTQLTNCTAEKHDASFQFKVTVLPLTSSPARFWIVQGEPDGHPSPTAVFAPRLRPGYYHRLGSITSPAFLMETPNGSTFCIPTRVHLHDRRSILDRKPPCLRSTQAI